MRSIKFIFIFFIFICSFLSVNAQISESEPNDTFGNANIVDISSGNLNITGAINPVGDQDKFKFTITSREFITFETFDGSGIGCAGGMDTIVRLYNSSLTEIASNDDDGINNCSKLEIGLAAGTYYVHIEDFFNNKPIPAYLMKIAVVPQVNEFEPNDNFDQADSSPIQITSSMEIIRTGNELDYFRLTLTSPQVVRFNNYTPIGSCQGITLSLYNSFRDPIGDYSTIGNDCLPVSIRLPANTYYFRTTVSVLGDTLRVLIDPTSYVNEFEPNNTFTDANLSPLQINSNLDVVGAINVLGEVDRYRVNLSQGSNVTFETFSDTNGTVCDSIDTLIRLYDSNGTELIFNDDGGINNCSLIQNLNLPAGIYYIQVGAFSSVAIIPQYLLRTTIIPDVPPSNPKFDFDGDGKTDVSIFRPSVGEWWYQRSSDGGNLATQFGTSSDKIAPADFTGDGKTDITFWRPSDGFWFILRSEDSSYFAFPFGATGDIPVPNDYDGDGKADPAVFRPSTATWFISRSSDGGISFFNFGANGDKPVVADYDGDGLTDIAIFRPNGSSGAEWWYQKSSTGQVSALQFGVSTDKPVQGDYTGDGKDDVAFFRPSTGFWFVLRSEDNSFFAFPWGTNGDIPAPGDYDGDGRTDSAVFRPSDTVWYLNNSTNGVQTVQFGTSQDLPIPSAFVP